MYLEGRVAEWTGRARTWATGVLVAMYIAAPLSLTGAMALVFGVVRVPRPGGWIGGLLATLFTAAGGLRGAGDEPQPARRAGPRSTARCGGC